MIARRWMRGVSALAGVALCGVVMAARMRPAEADPAAFVAESRAATARYADQRNAVNDGFTRVGVEFPAMGEHWVSFSRVMEDSFAAHRPSVLIYMNERAGPRLAGVAYTRLLTGRGTPPSFPYEGAWHEHSGAVDEESLPFGHTGHAKPSAAGDDSPRLFILHAWVWVPNADGVFATDNWSLPLARLGISVAAGTPREVVRAISLATDDDEYHRLVLRTTLALTDAEDSLAATAITTHRARAAAEVARLGRGHRLSREESDHFLAIWDGMWLELGRLLPARAGPLRDLRRQMQEA